MAVVQSSSGLVAISKRENAGFSVFAAALYDSTTLSYEDIYKQQPELRSAIDFLARNIAQLPIHAYVRLDDLERERLTGVPLTETLERPDVNVTRSSWLEALVKDLAIYDEYYAVKVRSDEGRIALVRIPPASVELIGENWLVPDAYRVKGTTGFVDFRRDQVIAIHGYHPSDPRRGLSPIETLRRVLAEQAAAGRYREKFWSNSARLGGVIERPPTAPNWSPEARARFRADFEAGYTGVASSGRTVVLEEGMTYRPISSSMRDAQYLESFQLSREVVATAYGIPVGLLGLGNPNYASLSEQHRQLYTDCLAPWLVRIQEGLEQQLVPEFDVPEDTYLEFNIGAKLAGSFVEQAAVLQASVGAPYLSRNEARARLNLAPIAGGDELVTPLNVITGGQASPQDSVSDERILAGAASSDPVGKADTCAHGKSDDGKADAKPDHAKLARQRRIQRERTAASEEFHAALSATLKRQSRSVVSKLGAKAKSKVKATAEDVFNPERFTAELAADLKPEIKKLARRMAATVADWDPDNAEEYFDTIAGSMAASFNEATFERLDTLLEDDEVEAEDVEDLFDTIIDGTALSIAASLATSVGEFARSEAAAAADLPEKTWVTTSSNPRSSHAALNGRTVARNETFPNGARFPGDYEAGAEESAQCQCLIDWGV